MPQGQYLKASFSISNPAVNVPGNLVENGLTTLGPVPSWEIPMTLLDPDFGLAIPAILAIWGVNQRMDDFCFPSL